MHGNWISSKRLNFIKLLPIHNVISSFSDHHATIHIKQHYDNYQLSCIFLKIPFAKTEFDLDTGYGTAGYQICEMRDLKNVSLMSELN